MSSFKAEVIADSSGNWSGNAIRLPTEEQAWAYGNDLSMRWSSVRQMRVLASDDPPNYTFEHGGLKPYSVLAQSMLLDTQQGGKS